MKSHRDQSEGTLVFNIDLTRGVVAGLALAVIAAALLGYLGWGQTTVSADALGDSPAAPAASTGWRRYYLTVDSYNGDQADGADVCAEGFHFASIWEILDPSSLVYDSSLGYALADSGSGPPIANGWIRTGNEANGDATKAGIANCSAWSSDSSSHNGTFARLVGDWSLEPTVHVWYANPMQCHVYHRIWCVED